MIALEEYDYEIEYKKGKENTAADSLSRLYLIANKEIQSDLENPNYYDEYLFYLLEYILLRLFSI